MFLIIIIAIIAISTISFALFHALKGKEDWFSISAINNTTKQTEEKGLENTENNNRWTLLEFAQLHGKMQIQVEHTLDGKTYLRKCKFTAFNGEIIYTNISKPLQQWSIKQIEEKKDNLIIIILESGTLCLCERWEDIDL